MNKSEKTKYILYARKSSESEDRQVQSIDDQRTRLKQLASELKINIVCELTESKSAKEPDIRPQFRKMVEMIESGEANGILCWKLDRLFRNPKDQGEIHWLLCKKILQSIQTIEREYIPETNALLLSVEGGMSTQFIKDLSTNTKRGLQGKFEKGWYPFQAPIGYLNHKEEKIIINDPERFDLVKKIWAMMLSGKYSPPKILQIANNEWGLRTVKRKRIGGQKLSRSGIYNVLTNLFYAGVLVDSSDKEHKGKHEPMVTLEEFDRVQFLLGRKGKARPKKHAFAFTGLIRCGECGCMITAERKQKFIKSCSEVREYVYYHCTKRKKEIKCTQKTVVREDALEKQIADEIGKFTILPEFKDWALEVIREENQKEVEDRSTIYESQHRALTETQKKLDRLVEMRLNDLLNDEQFKEKRSELETDIKNQKRALRDTENRAENWVEIAENAFNFATHARVAFLNGDLDTKKQILMSLGSNQTLKDGKLAIEASPWLVPIKNDYPAIKEQFVRLEPAQVPESSRRRAYALRPLTPPYVRFRIRRFQKLSIARFK